ncbi:MAG: ribulose-phosphate 3-epimerase [Dehalococcoidia bacterium]|nr:ribulose-phosphate 3-epimerase [Dehalococcoidia bacterium]
MARLSQVVPALLTEDPKTLESLVRQTESFTNYVQFDIMDGEFVPSRSITCEHLAALAMKLSWEAHLMVLHPEEYLESFRQAGAQKVVFHFEATSSPREVVSQARGLGLQVGLAVNPETPVSAILPLAGEVDSVLFLTVHPGFYGSQFLPEVLDNVIEFRSSHPNAEIGVDGGIKEGNVAQIARLGVDVIYVGSAISLQPDPAESFRHLQALAHEGSRQQGR